MAHPQHPVSQEQLAANRADAAKSTGPHTPQGKACSAQNARKHGFTVSPFAVVRLEDLLEELPNEPIIEAEPEQNETTCTPSETNPSPPERPVRAPGPPASVSELELDLAGAPGVLEDREVEARYPGSAPVPRAASRVIEGEAWRLPEHRGTEAPLRHSAGFSGTIENYTALPKEPQHQTNYEE
jgi:hypothetical protein